MLETSTLAFYFKTQTAYEVYTLHNCPPSNYKASNSTILSLVSYLLINNPDLPHPYPEYKDFKIKLPFDQMTS